MKEELKEHLRRKLNQSILNEVSLHGQDGYEPDGYLTPAEEQEISPIVRPNPLLNPFDRPWDIGGQFSEYGITPAYLKWLKDTVGEDKYAYYYNMLLWYLLNNPSKLREIIIDIFNHINRPQFPR